MAKKNAAEIRAMQARRLVAGTPEFRLGVGIAHVDRLNDVEITNETADVYRIVHENALGFFKELRDAAAREILERAGQNSGA